MTLRQYLNLLSYGARAILTGKAGPILGTIILTDRCNLHCRHCAVNNVDGHMLRHDEVRAEMTRFLKAGIRILFFCGGETFLWKDGDRTVHDLVREAKDLGFYLVNVVTNGTLGLRLPEADIVFLSLDGLEASHNDIRGETFSAIMEKVAEAGDTNLCAYMAVNARNFRDIEGLTRLVADTPNLSSISFNFHTPHAGTEALALSREQKEEAVAVIHSLIRRGFPVFNLPSALDAFLSGSWERPCRQCVVSEKGKWFDCGRCVEIEGLCGQCGYLFAVEFSLLLRGNVKAILEMLGTYRRFCS